MVEESLLASITTLPAAICLMDAPYPVAYFNIYEPGDVWLKIKDCTDCPQDHRDKCCGTCPLKMQNGCAYHLENKRGSNKPYHCVIEPGPDVCHSYCQLAFLCINGKHKGKIRNAHEPGNVFRDA